MRTHYPESDDSNVVTKLSNVVGGGRPAANAMLVVAYAYLVREVGTVVQIVLRAFGHG